MRWSEGSILGSRVYAWLSDACRFVGLGVLWAACCVPVVTVLPATAALFAVARRWAGGDEPGLLRSYFHAFTENFRQAMVLSLLAGVVGLGLLGDRLLLTQLDVVLRGAIELGLIAVGVGALAVVLHALAHLVSWHTSVGRLIRFSILLALGRPVASLGCLLVVAVIAVLTWMFPPAPVLLAGVGATLILRISSAASSSILKVP